MSDPEHRAAPGDRAAVARGFATPDLLLAAGNGRLSAWAWAVELKSDGRMVGHLGFFDREREMTRAWSGNREMGWIFDRSVHGQGIALEACQAALEWAEREFGPSEKSCAIISTDNIPSMKLAERLGFVREPDGLYKV